MKISQLRKSLERLEELGGDVPVVLHSLNQETENHEFITQFDITVCDVPMDMEGETQRLCAFMPKGMIELGQAKKVEANG